MQKEGKGIEYFTEIEKKQRKIHKLKSKVHNYFKLRNFSFRLKSSPRKKKITESFSPNSRKTNSRMVKLFWPMS